MIKKITQTITFMLLMLTLVLCATGNPEHEFDIMGNWAEKNTKPATASYSSGRISYPYGTYTTA